MKIFWPEIRYWFPWRSARVRTSDRSDPACGSVRFIVPVHLPSIILGRYACFRASEPRSSKASTAPWVRSGQSEKLKFELFHISCTGVETSLGSPCPPHSCAKGSAFHPPSQNLRYASRKPRGVRTSPSLNLEPSWSPEKLIGSSTSDANLEASSRMASTVSGLASSKPVSLATSDSPESSLSTNLMSFRGAT